MNPLLNLNWQPQSAGPDFYKQVMGNGIAAPSMLFFAPAGRLEASGQTPQPLPPLPAALNARSFPALPSRPAPNTMAMHPGLVAPIPRPYPIRPATYTIRKGDTLTSIAKRFGTTVQALQAKNGIKNANRIVAGHTLKL